MFKVHCRWSCFWRSVSAWYGVWMDLDGSNLVSSWLLKPVRKQHKVNINIVIHLGEAHRVCSSPFFSVVCFFSSIFPQIAKLWGSYFK